MKVTWKSSVWMFLITTFLVAPFLKFQEADHRKTTQDKFDYINQNRPYLEPELVIDSVESNAVIYHYEIQNTGVLPASSISEEEISANVTRPTFSAHNRFLAPQAKMSLLSYSMFISNSPPVMDISLFLTYRGAYRETNLEFNSLFRFLIPEKQLIAGKFNYVENKPELHENPIHGTNTMGQFYAKALDQPSGTISFWVSNDASDIAASSNRIFLLDGATRTVFFKSITSSGSPIVLVGEIETNVSHRHFILTSWASNRALLMVDTNIISFPEAKDVQIFNRTLTSNEIKESWENGPPTNDKSVTKTLDGVK